MEKITVKDRILIYTDLIRVSKAEMARKIGVHSSSLMPSAMKNHLGSDAVVRFLTTFKDVSPDWLMLGHEPMLRRSTDGVINGDVNNHAENNSSASITLNMERHNYEEILKAKDETIRTLQALVESQQRTIELLSKNNDA